MSAAITEASVARHTAQVSESALRRPRVLHLITSFEIGGTERQAVELLKRLNGERYDVRLAVLRKEGPFYQEIEQRFPDVPEFPLTSFYDANAVKQLARLRRLMLREKIDILHAHDFYSSLIGAAAARLSGVRVIASQRHLKLSDRRAHKWGTRMIHRLANRILVNSQAIREHIINNDGAQPGKIVVVKNGIVPASSSNSCDELRIELGLDKNVTLVGIVARLQTVKGHRFFVEAAVEVLRSRPNAHFVLVGDGPLRTEIENQAARLGISDHVHLLGDRSDTSRLVSAFDLLVLASLHEGLPNAVMEAMGAGVAVVATSVGGTKELIIDGETGYLAPPANSAALADRIIFALGDESHRDEIVSAARLKITSAFGIEKMVRSVEALYDEMYGDHIGPIGLIGPI
jgi:glycosyltransferase involved in cell wall biosynthesis